MDLSLDTDPRVAGRLVLNHSLAPSPAMDVPFLLRVATRRSRALLDAVLADADPAVRRALEPSWLGTLAELATACATFCADAS